MNESRQQRVDDKRAQDIRAGFAAHFYACAGFHFALPSVSYL